MAASKNNNKIKIKVALHVGFKLIAFLQRPQRRGCFHPLKSTLQRQGTDTNNNTIGPVLPVALIPRYAGLIGRALRYGNIKRLMLKKLHDSLVNKVLVREKDNLRCRDEKIQQQLGQ